MIKHTRQLLFSNLISLALAECRGAWRRLIFFVICLAIGVGAVMTVKSFSVLVESTISREAKSLLAADIEVKSSWAQSPADIDFQKHNLPTGSEFQFVKEMKAMTQYPLKKPESKKRASLLVELKALPVSEPHYPMYGKLKTRPAIPLTDLLDDNGALVEPSYLIRTGLNIGDTFQLGNTRVRITAVITAEPDRLSRSFSIGPRVMISNKTLQAAKLVRTGSRINHRTLIRLPENTDLQKTVTMLETGLEDKTSVVRSYKAMQSSLNQAITQISQYLSCIGVIALLMGGIGIAMIVRTFMTQKMDTIAIMNCIGATGKTIFHIYLLQSLLLGILGSLLGIGFGFALQYLLPARLNGLLNIAITPSFFWTPSAQALLLGLITTLLFSVWPLIRAVKVRPLRLFRHITEEESLTKTSRRERWSAGATFFVPLLAIVFWQAGSVKRGMIFLAAVMVSTLLLGGVSQLTLFLLRKLPAPRNMISRYGIANIYRPNNQAASIITALGMGIMLLLTIRLVQMDMTAMLKENRNINPPNYFFIDIQPDQEKKFLDALNREAPSAERKVTPLVRSRFYSIDDRSIDQWNFESPRHERWLKREFVLTHRTGDLPPDNEVIKGKWWGAGDAKRPQVSLEEDAAFRLGAKIGSVLTMDIQGMKVKAPVTSIRKVDWRNMRTNFYIIFSPEALEGVPASLVATVHVPPGKELKVQQAVVESLPNVTAISTKDIVDTVENVINKLITLVDFMSAFSILAGLFILSGAIASTKFRRLKESAILKTIGAKRGQVSRILGAEYASLGLIASSVGSLLALALSYTIMETLVKAEWNFHPVMLIVTFTSAVLLTTLTGVISSIDVLTNKPLHTLRQIGG